MSQSDSLYFDSEARPSWGRTWTKEWVWRVWAGGQPIKSVTFGRTRRAALRELGLRYDLDRCRVDYLDHRTVMR